jgi:hypothetical protein
MKKPIKLLYSIETLIVGTAAVLILLIKLCTL